MVKEVERLLREGKAAGSKELAEYLEVEGYAKAAQWVYAQAVQQSPDWSPRNLISLTELRQIHRLAVEPVWLHSPPDSLQVGEGPGSFRKHDIRPFGGGSDGNGRTGRLATNLPLVRTAIPLPSSTRGNARST